MAMTMEEDEDAEIEHVFIAHEIDLDYEFDAARFFDFTRPETFAEAHQAELWFENAPSYPPSPFVSRLMVREDSLFDDVSDSPKSKYFECTSNVDDDKSTVPSGMRFSDAVFDNNGLTLDSKTISDSFNTEVKSVVSKNSSLMKLTASQLAKQNRLNKIVGSRFQKPLSQNQMNLSISSGGESQAAKRQKLEGGLLCKVTDVKQQASFVHKTRMRAVTVEQITSCSKLRITIPREPDLKTAHRAQRIRPKNGGEAEHMTTAPRFKARPLNRKILDAPSLPLPKRSTPRLPEFQEFHLKTLERAMKHTSATTSSIHCNDSDKGWDKNASVSALENRIKDFGRPIATDAPKYDRLGFTHIFKARPLNKKIPSSKGDIGVFQNRKQDTTVPMEFDLHNEKGVQHNPPIELFSKLSLISEAQPNNGSHFKLPQHSGMCRKEKTCIFGAKQIHHGNGHGGCISLMSRTRSLGIR